MAKLCSYYRLCPLIDTKSLLGISNDVEKGMVIVTLGKNMAIKYRLLDQKQICSWRTKDKFSSLIVYCKMISKYVAVFNHYIIKMWSENDENLDKLKKYKSTFQIRTILPCEENVYVLFKNGAIYDLEDFIHQRKTLEIEEVINENQEIEDVLQICIENQLYVGYIVKDELFTVLYWADSNHFPNRFTKIILHKEGCQLRGYVFHQGENCVNLLTLWSDGRVYLCPLETSDIDINGPGEPFTVIDNISTENTVSIVSLDKNYIALYGADLSEEGAVLLIYNTQFKVTPSKQIHKLFTTESKIWRIENNLFLPVGQNLVVVPFRLESEQLAALVGSHKFIQENVDPDIKIVQEYEVVNWLDKKTKIKKIVQDPETQFSNLLSQGISEAQVIEHILPEILKNRDIRSLKSVLKFRDIPESFIAQILKFLLSAKGKLFDKKTSCFLEHFPQELQPLGRIELLDDILTRPFSEVLLLPYIHLELSLEEVLLLIKYICFMLSENGHKFHKSSMVKTEEKLINWGCLLLDANYQRLLLSKDESVLDVLTNLNTIINDELETLDKIVDVVPALQRVKTGKALNLENNIINSKYSVEQISLY